MADEQEVAPRQRGMTPVSVLLAAGVERNFELPGDWFHVVDAPVADLIVRFDAGEPNKVYQGIGLRRYYQSFSLASATGQAVRVYAGFGSVTDGRASVTGLTLNTTIAPGNTFSDGARVLCVHAARTQLLVADATRLYALIGNPSTNTLTQYIGTVGVIATSGIPLEPGQMLPLATTAALYAWNADPALDENLWAASVKQ